jgi:hypothetical protein
VPLPPGAEKWWVSGQNPWSKMESSSTSRYTGRIANFHKKSAIFYGMEMNILMEFMIFSNTSNPKRIRYNTGLCSPAIADAPPALTAVEPSWEKMLLM